MQEEQVKAKERLKLSKKDAYSIAAVFRRRDSIVNEFSERMIVYDDRRASLDTAFGDPLDVVLPLILPIFIKHLDAPSVVVEQTLLALLTKAEGGYPLRADYRRAAWIMAANREQLQRGTPLDVFSEIGIPEWAPVVVQDVWNDITHWGERAVSLVFLCLGGRATMQRFSQTFNSLRFGNVIKRIMFGLPKYSDARYQEFGGLRTWVYLEKGPLHFEYFGCNSAFSQYNRRLTNERRNSCVFSPPLPLPCSTCRMGMDQCYRAVHSKSWELRDCPMCQKRAYFIKHDKEATICLDCQRQVLLQNKRKTIVKGRKKNEPEPDNA